MSDRDDLVEACYWAAPTLDRGPSGPDDDREGLEMGRRLNRAGLMLIRDGLVFKELHALIARLSTGSDRSKEIAEELKSIVGDAR